MMHTCFHFKQEGFYQSSKMLFMCQFILLTTYIKFLASSNHLRHLARENQDFQNLKPNLTNFCNKLTIYNTIITLRHTQASVNIQLYRYFCILEFPIILLPYSQFGQTLSTEDWSHQT